MSTATLIETEAARFDRELAFGSSPRRLSVLAVRLGELAMSLYKSDPNNAHRWLVVAKDWSRIAVALCEEAKEASV